MLDPVPLGRAGRQVADGDAKAGLGGQGGKLGFHSRSRDPLDPPESAVISNRLASG